MKTSIATVSLSGSLTEKLHACAAAGFDGVELFEPDLIANDHSPEEIRALAGRLGLSLDLYQPLRDIEGVDEDDVRRQPAPRRGHLRDRATARHPTRCWSAATSRPPPSTPTRCPPTSCADSATWPRQYDIKVAFEALAWGRFVDDYRRAWRIVELADHPNVGVCLDSFHVLSRGHDPAAIEDIPADKIFFLQLADAPALTMDVLSWSRHHRLFPGEGAFDLADLRLATCWPPATTVRCRWRSSTTPSARPTRTAPRCTRCARCSGCRTRPRASTRRAGGAISPPSPRPSRPPASTSSNSRPRTPARSRCCSSSSASRRAGGTAPSRCRCGPRATPASCSTNSRPATRSRTSPPSACRCPTRPPPRRRAAELMAPRGLPPDLRHRAGARRGRRPRRHRDVLGPTDAGVGRGVRERPARRADAGARHRPRQPGAAVADLRRRGAVLHQRVRACRPTCRPRCRAQRAWCAAKSMRTADDAVRLLLNVAPHVLDDAGHAPARGLRMLRRDRGWPVPRAPAGLQLLSVPDNYYDYLAGRFGLDDDHGGRAARARPALRPRRRRRVRALLHPHRRHGVLRVRAAARVVTTGTAQTTLRCGWLPSAARRIGTVRA